MAILHAMLRHLLLSCSFAFAALPAQQAPVLTFVGTAERGPASDGEHTWLVDPAGDGPAEDLGAGRIDVADVFDDEWLVCRDSGPKTYFTLLQRHPGDDGRRQQRPLVPGGHCSTVPRFVDVQHRRLYVLCDRWDDRQGSLRMFELGGPEHGRELLDQVKVVIAHSIDGMFVLRDTGDGDVDQLSVDHHLWFVPPQPGGARRVLDVTMRAGVFGLAGDTAFSPDNRHLAIGDNALMGGGGNIWVVDTIAGKLVARLTGIRIEVSMLSSQMPALRLSWQDATTLRYSRTGASGFEWASWSLTTREEVTAEHYSPIALSHQRPPVKPHAHALRVDDTGIRFAAAAAAATADTTADAASDAPVIARPGASWWTDTHKLSLSADHRYAAWFDGTSLQLLDGPGRRMRTVYRGSFDFPNWRPGQN